MMSDVTDCAESPETIAMEETRETETGTGRDSPACSKAGAEAASSASLLYSRELSQINEFEQPSRADLEKCRVLLGPRRQRLTLVLDLDQTLVYSVPLDEESACGEGIKFSVKIRPFAQELIQKMSSKFELVVFSAADDAYVRAVVGLLDPDRKYVSRVLTKTSCIAVKQGQLVKDLRIFADRSLSEILMVDDNIYSYAFQLGNGIPVTPYAGEDDDNELYYLMGYLDELCEEQEPLHVNTQKIGLCTV